MGGGQSRDWWPDGLCLPSGEGSSGCVSGSYPGPWKGWAEDARCGQKMQDVCSTHYPLAAPSLRCPSPPPAV